MVHQAHRAVDTVVDQVMVTAVVSPIDLLVVVTQQVAVVAVATQL